MTGIAEEETGFDIPIEFQGFDFIDGGRLIGPGGVGAEEKPVLPVSTDDSCHSIRRKMAIGVTGVEIDVPSDQVLQEGDRVSFTPTKIEGA